MKSKFFIFILLTLLFTSMVGISTMTAQDSGVVAAASIFTATDSQDQALEGKLFASTSTLAESQDTLTVTPQESATVDESQGLVQSAKDGLDSLSSWLITLSSILTLLAGFAVRFGFIKDKTAKDAIEQIKDAELTIKEGEKMLDDVVNVIDKVKLDNKEFIDTANKIGSQAGLFLKRKFNIT